jgi:hypothetical protein
LWKRKVQTYTMETATMAWAKIEYWFIFIIDFKSRRHFFSCWLNQLRMNILKKRNSGAYYFTKRIVRVQWYTFLIDYFFQIK